MPIKRKKIKELIKKIFIDFNISEADITIIFVNNNFIRRLNKQYFKRNYNTDIITLNYNDVKDKNIIADIFISTEQVKENSKDYKCDFKTELLRVIVHGILHTIGFSDNSNEEKQKMHDLENYYIKVFNTN
ncbi:MAG: rRNA maturation RNase YbeY [Bacteroidales bacterium]|nr:rRNA maturation RNase YbeY [Bacteroidales bacterium]